MVCIGTHNETSKKAIEFAKQYDFISATIGVHPCEVKYDTESLPYFREIVEQKKDKIELI